MFDHLTCWCHISTCSKSHRYRVDVIFCRNSALLSLDQGFSDPCSMVLHSAIISQLVTLLQLGFRAKNRHELMHKFDYMFFSSPSCWSMYPINSHYISLNPWDLVAYPLEFLFPLSFPKTSFDSEIRGDSSRLETRGRKSGPRLRAVPGTCTAAFGSGGGWRADSAAPAPSGRVGIPGIPGDDLGMFQMMSASWWCVNVSMFDDFLVSLFFDQRWWSQVLQGTQPHIIPSIKANLSQFTLISHDVFPRCSPHFISAI